MYENQFAGTSVPRTVKAQAKRPRRSRGQAASARTDTRQALIWCGTELLTERGFHAIGIDEVLKLVGVPKGSFYHFFESKQAFLEAVIENCREYYRNKYEGILLNPNQAPLDRIRDFVAQAIVGMEKFGFKRGCLVGNLGQELASMDNHIGSILDEIMMSWEETLRKCLQEAVANGDLLAGTDVKRLAQFFFTGWQGAVLRSKLKKSGEPLTLFVNVFLDSLCAKRADTTLPLADLTISRRPYRSQGS